ncbi:MAG TPA: hypothetical protein VK638_12005 [Edaphobacter sp.]|nr:hypothetical protein [Edaphobacter sp.]
MSRFQFNAQAPILNLFRERRGNSGLSDRCHIAVTGPATGRSDGASNPLEHIPIFTFPENLQAMDLTLSKLGTHSTFATYSISS